MKLFITFLLFLPACAIGFLIECGRPGYETGYEIYHDTVYPRR